jgi:hypothetical protein
MRVLTAKRLNMLAAVVFVLGILLQPLLGARAQAQDAPAVETTVTEPATFTPTATNTVPTDTPTPTPTTTLPTDTPTPTSTGVESPGPGETPTSTPTLPTSPPSGSRPVPIPEPVTVVLFGTGLAALSAAVAARRRKGD